MLRFVILASTLVLSSSALAEDLEGIVRVAGSAVNSQVLIGDEGSSPAVCRDDTGKRIGRLTGMTVKVTGDWQMTKKGDKKCLTATSFTILKMSSGRPAVVGTLSQKDGAFVVASDEGVSHTLEDVPAGLKKLDGQKVIIDVKPMETPAASTAAFKVVSYAAFP